MTPPPLPPLARPKTLTPQPTLLLAWRGIWRLTWANQFTWRRLAVPLLLVLALPTLMYFVAPTPEGWSQRHSLLGDPGPRLDELARRLNQAKVPLRPEQFAQLQPIFAEEFARAEAADRGDAAAPGRATPRSAEVRATYERIESRAEAVLDKRQFEQFPRFKRRSLEASLRRANEPVPHWTTPYYALLINFYFFIALPLLCVQVSGGLIRNELQADTLGFLTSRPLSRARLLSLKYLCQTIWLQALLLIVTGLLFGAGHLRQIPALGALLPLFLAAQFLAVFAWSALGVLMGQITNRYIVLALVYGAIVELGVGRIPTNINKLSVLRHLQTLLAHDATLQNLYQWSGAGVPLSVGALLLAPAIFLGLAALLFTYLEYHPTAELQK